jgi:DNA modification methylase
MHGVQAGLLRGDCLHTAGCFREDPFDLIYIDPPFFTGRAQRMQSGMGFDDRWRGDLSSYLAWLMPRVDQMRWILSPTGSMFVHLDWHAVHAVKVAMDDLFGRDRFINEIIWSYRTGGAGGRWLARKHDTVLFYAKSADYKFHRLRERSSLAHKYGFANAGVREDHAGPYRMTLMRDVWDIPALRGNNAERADFPTQKPLSLLTRIIELVTDPGDLVGDFLCGSGTTLVAALLAGRRAIGGDLSEEALRLTRERIAALDPAVDRTKAAGQNPHRRREPN